ncbi:MAG: MYXO-CTERM sorting domain-containing protein [Myxococcota bacterium]|nr:MYXO-CTERM sorting domain-containing protein [Myxococcota bacterium]MEC8425463.1 MYXO-CTERM sorting domain-containing protein [Myxococcota bacterium]
MLLLLLPTALAHESVPQGFVLEDAAELWRNSEFRTGWVPADSPLQVEFAIESTGGAFVGMEGDAHLTWPDPFLLELVPMAESGWIIVDAMLSAVTSIRFDVPGYTWSQEIDRRGLQVEGASLFEPFLLQGAETDIVQVDYTGSETELVSFDVSVFTGVTVNFATNIGPQASTTFQGLRWWTEDGALAQAGSTAMLEPSDEAYQSAEATFVGRWTSALDLVLTPVFTVETPVADFELVRIDIPVPLGSDDFEQAFPATVVDFPLPILRSPAAEYDFGEIEVNDVVNWEMEIENEGSLVLEGFIGLTGSPYFSSFPAAFLVAPGGAGGAVVTFAPEAAGEFSGRLVLESNDPLQPIQEIVVRGTAFEPEVDGDDDRTDIQRRTRVIETEVGCGCGTTGAPVWPGLMAFAVGGLAVVWRRRDEED